MAIFDELKQRIGNPGNPGGMGFWIPQPDGSMIGGDSFTGRTRKPINDYDLQISKNNEQPVVNPINQQQRDYEFYQQALMQRKRIDMERQRQMELGRMKQAENEQFRSTARPSGQAIMPTDMSNQVGNMREQLSNYINTQNFRQPAFPTQDTSLLGIRNRARQIDPTDYYQNVE